MCCDYEDGQRSFRTACKNESLRKRRERTRFIPQIAMLWSDEARRRVPGTCPRDRMIRQ
jgi:hypothetical protein